MEGPAVTCHKCRAILEFYRHDIATILGVASSEVNVDAIIKRHSLQPTSTWKLESPRNQSKIVKCSYQCRADPDHHWVTNHVDQPFTIKEIGA